MDIVISGTKFGWGYFTDKQLLGLFDIGAGAGIKAIAQQAYAINYKNNNCIFTKYRIVKDVRGDKRIGFVAFSLFLPFDKKLSGKTIKTVLDKVESEYCKKYIPDGKNLEDVRENFNFLDTISIEYDKDIRSNSSFVSGDMQSGSTDAAFVYYPYVYKDIQMQKEMQLELEDIFDAPFQEEYTPYRQILFISNDLKGKDENPLVALQHSDNDLTGKVDLGNEYYYLTNYNSSKGVTITANGKPRSDGKNNNCIRAKWQIEIRYSKDDRCYEPIQASGTLSNPSSEIFKYLEINGNQIKIKYDAFNNLTPKSKPVNLEIKDRNGKNIDGAKIIYQTEDRKETTITSNTIHFTGEEIVKRWIVSAKKGDVFVSDKVSVYPDKQDTVEIKMHEIKKVEITAANENGIVDNFRVCINNVRQQAIPLEFKDEDIEKECYIEVSKSEGKEYYSGGANFCPKSNSKIHIQLTKREPKKHIPYALDMGEHGSATAGYSNKEDGSDINVTVKTKGYVFKGFQLDRSNKKDNCSGTLVAQYEKKASFYKKTKLIAGSVVGLLILGFSIWAFCHFLNKDKTDETLIDKTTITKYVNGDSLMLNKLNSDKENWERQKPKIKKEGGGIFGGGEEKSDFTEYKEWDEVLQMINIAIEKRNLVDSKDFKELKSQTYSPTQEKFKDAINKIDSITSVEIGQKLGEVSTLTLKQITDEINKILTQKESVKEKQQQEVKKDEKQTTPKKENLQSAKSVEQPESKEQKSATLPAQQQSTSTNTIISYIKGSELDETKLREYKKTKGINQNLKNSIQLCLDFWALDGSGNGKTSKTYWTFRDKVKADNNLSNSNLKAFLDKICQEGANPSYSKQDKMKGLK